MRRKMSVFINSFFLFIVNSLLFLFRFIAFHVLSKNSLRREDDKVEKKDRIFSFKLQYQICKDKDNPVEIMEENCSSMTCSDFHQYKFRSDKNVSFVMDETEEMNQVHESFKDTRFSSAEGFQKKTLEAMAKDKTDDDNFLNALNMMQPKKKFSEEEKFNSGCSEFSSVGEREDELEFSDFNSNTETSSDDRYSARDLIIDSCFVSFLSDGYFGDCEHETEIRETSVNSINELAEGNSELFLERSGVEEENDDVEEKKHISSAEKNIYRKIYSNESALKIKIQSNKRQTRERHIRFEEKSKNDETFFIKNGGASLDNFGEVELESKPETFNRDEVGKTADDNSYNDLSDSLYGSYEQQHTIDNHDIESKKIKLEGKESKETFTLDLDEDEYDEMWEHQDLIMQLKMELKKVRAIGLPTILEESESSRAVEDSKSFKIEKKLSHEDHMDEFHKLYKRYKDGMRKLDALNYQKMYATGFLQLRDPLELNKTQKPIFSTIISHFSESFLPFIKKKSKCVPPEQYIKELRCDLETVYVGQICLTWEFLRCQYENLHMMKDYDSFISHQYNNVAAEFQQFIVTLQRFIENEMFQAPRVANYVKQRCLLRNLLQLPAVKEDFLVEKGREEEVITREMLEDIMEEAMRIFWEFVKADKHETIKFLKDLVQNHVKLQDASDYEFMVDIQASLQKKERKLKNHLKAGNCIVKMLKKRQECRSNQDLFLTQIDLKIVSRVLRMSRLTSDQLIWCQKMLNKITFSGINIHRESSFLPFPC